MSVDVELKCRCGNVSGRVRDVSASTVNRAVCYCDDCQAFAHHLGRAELLDARGGTDIVQVAPASVSFDQGVEHIAGLRLTPKGLFRWYARCCNTPLGNTLKPAVPFVGIGISAFRDAPDERQRDEIFGKCRGSTQGKFAIGGPPEGSALPSFRMLAHVTRLLVTWKLGKAWPNPFFDRETREPKIPITILSRDERDALRPLCGPHPTADHRS